MVVVFICKFAELKIRMGFVGCKFRLGLFTARTEAQIHQERDSRPILLAPATGIPYSGGFACCLFVPMSFEVKSASFPANGCTLVTDSF